jgi:hypothetical protein
VADPAAAAPAEPAVVAAPEMPAAAASEPAPAAVIEPAAAPVEVADSWAMAIPEAPVAAIPVVEPAPEQVPETAQVAPVANPAPEQIAIEPAAEPARAEPTTAPAPEVSAEVPASDVSIPSAPIAAAQAAPEAPSQPGDAEPAPLPTSSDATPAAVALPPAAEQPAPSPAAPEAPADGGLASPEELLAAAMAAGFFTSPPDDAPRPEAPAPSAEAAGPARQSLADLPEPQADAPRDPEPEYRPAPGKLLVDELLARVNESDKLAEALLWFCEGRFTTGLLLTVEGGAAVGWSVQGPNADAARVATLSIPLDQDSLVRDAIKEMAPVVRAEPAHSLDRKLLAFLGHHPNSGAAAVPFVVKGEVVSVLFGTRGSWPLAENLAEDLDRVANSTARVYDRIMLARKPMR